MAAETCSYLHQYDQGFIHDFILFIYFFLLGGGGGTSVYRKQNGCVTLYSAAVNQLE